MMKKVYWLVVWSVVCSVVLMGGDKQALASQSSFSPIVGTYSGQVWNGNDMDPVLTTFFVNGSGELVGKYAMGEEKGLEMGEIFNVRTEGKYTLVVKWKDKYGSGTLRILFSSDYKKFYGFWGDHNTPISLPWNGRKQ